MPQVNCRGMLPGQIIIGHEVGTGTQKYPSRQFLRQGVQQGGFSAAAYDGGHAFFDAQYGMKLHPDPSFSP